MRGQLRTADGFSLIELLIAIAVLGVVLPALGTAFYVSARTVDGTTDRVTSSAATTLATADFGRDIQSSLSLVTDSSSGCPAPGGGTALFTLARTDATVTWFSTGEAIGRHTCLGGTTTTTTLPIELSTAPTVTCFNQDGVPMGCTTTGVDKLTSVSLSLSPLESARVKLHATRRNP